MSHYDDDAESLGDTCDWCGLSFLECYCEYDYDPCEVCGRPCGPPAGRVLCPDCLEKAS